MNEINLLRKLDNHFLIKIRDFHSKKNFVCTLPHNAKVLDVGCGNGALIKKYWRHDIVYTGVDVEMFKISEEALSFSNKYVTCEPTKFADTIESLGKGFDAIISSHNIEHCNEPFKTIDAICNALKSGGYYTCRFRVRIA